ncbi:MAG: tail fiber domain-containing protein [Synechococcaceae cyanobacterium]
MRGAIPTETDFSDLIAAGLNQAEDGVYKLPNEPLSLVRQQADQAVLRFYEDPAATGCAWQITLTDQGRAGFAIANGDGKTSLFIDKATGNLGIGTNAPNQALTVNGTAAIKILRADEMWIAGQKLSASSLLEGKLTVLENGNVGIGVSTPAARLTVFHAANVSAIPKTDPDSQLNFAGYLAIKGPTPQLDFIDSDPNQPDWCIQVNDGNLRFYRSPWQDTGLSLQANGRVGIGTTAATAPLEVNGTIKCTELIINDKFRLDGVHNNDSWLRLYVRDSNAHGNLGFGAEQMWCRSGSFTGSDIGLKDQRSIRPIKDALLRVKELNPVHFRYKDQSVDSLPKLGFIAQEMEAVLPEVVGLGPEGMKGIQEGCLVALLAQAIKEQQAQIDAQQAQLLDLQAALAGIR